MGSRGLDFRESIFDKVLHASNTFATNNTDHFGNGDGSVGVISSDHGDLDSSLMAASNNAGNLLTRRIHDRDETQEAEVVGNGEFIVVGVKVLVANGAILSVVYLLANHTENTLSLAAHLDLHLDESLAELGSHSDLSSVLVEITVATINHGLRSSFHVHHHWKLLAHVVDSYHVLVLAVERDLSDDRFLRSLLVNIVDETSSKLEDGNIRGASSDFTLIEGQMSRSGVEFGTANRKAKHEDIGGQRRLKRKYVSEINIRECDRVSDG